MLYSTTKGTSGDMERRSLNCYKTKIYFKKTSRYLNVWISCVCLAIFIFNLGGEVVSNVSDFSDVIFHYQRNLRGHGETNLVGQTAGLGEHVQIPASEGEGNRFLHLNGDALLLLVDIAVLRNFDISNANITGGAELY